MITLLTALFYLWLVITILLGAMWFLRRQDINADSDDDIFDETVLSEPARPEPAVTEPDPEPEPELAEPVVTEPEPELAEPVVTEPEPELAEPVVTEPEPELAEPVVTEPEPAEVLDDAPSEAPPEAAVEAKKPPRKTRKNRKPAAKPNSTRAPSQNGTAPASEPGPDSGPDSDSRSPSVRQPQAQSEATADTKPENLTQTGPAALLEGLSLPYDLAPANERVADLDRHAILLSPHDDAEAVGTAFADELVKLGFEIEPDGLDQARAVRGDETLSLRISPNAGTRGSGKYRRYPTAGETDVAIEVWVGNGSPPKLASN